MKWFLFLLCISFVFGVSCTDSATKPRVYDKTKDFRDKKIEVSQAFSNTADFVGTEVFITTDENKEILVKISEIEFIKDTAGQLIVGKLFGETTWGSDSVKGIQYDMMEQLIAQKGMRVNSFNGSMLIDSSLKPGITADSVLFKKVTIDKHVLLCPTYFKGRNLLGSSLLISIDSLICLGVLKFDCVNALFCGGRCPKIRTADYFITTCSCPSGGACYLIPDGTDCITNKCTATCRNPIGWSAFCVCL